jgi:hypothetical protein
MEVTQGHSHLGTIPSTVVKQKFIENINSRDMSASFYVRTQQGYSLYDDFPPLSLMEYPQARDHMARVYKAIEKSDPRIRNLRIKILGEVALAAFTFHYDMIVAGQIIFLDISDSTWKYSQIT